MLGPIAPSPFAFKHRDGWWRELDFTPSSMDAAKDVSLWTQARLDDQAFVASSHPSAGRVYPRVGKTTVEVAVGGTPESAHYIGQPQRVVSGQCRQWRCTLYCKKRAISLAFHLSAAGGEDILYLGRIISTKLRVY
jgi:hypothetical protein